MGKPKGSSTVSKDRMLATYIALIPRPNEVAELGEIQAPLLSGINEVHVQPNGPGGPRWIFNFRNTTEVTLRVFLDLRSGEATQRLEQVATTPTRAEDMRTFLKAIEGDKENGTRAGEESSTKSESEISSGDNEGERGYTPVPPPDQEESSS